MPVYKFPATLYIVDDNGGKLQRLLVDPRRTRGYYGYSLRALFKLGGMSFRSTISFPKWAYPEEMEPVAPRMIFVPDEVEFPDEELLFQCMLYKIPLIGAEHYRFDCPVLTGRSYWDDVIEWAVDAYGSGFPRLHFGPLSLTLAGGSLASASAFYNHLKQVNLIHQIKNLLDKEPLDLPFHKYNVPSMDFPWCEARSYSDNFINMCAKGDLVYTYAKLLSLLGISMQPDSLFKEGLSLSKAKLEPASVDRLARTAVLLKAKDTRCID